ncbi:MAG: hypothetical protein JWL59_4376 [Chthoniobacteraceae bacterium]|nr:hypothetical protein [Chthoniobacteraceae bacterium]
MIQDKCHAVSCKKPSARGPVFETRGAVKVKVYEVKNRLTTAYQVVYSLAGKRERQTFTNLSEAKVAAQLAAEQVARGRINAATMTMDDRDTIAAVKRILSPLGISVIEAVQTYATAFAKLPKGTSLQEAVEDFAVRRREALNSRRITVIVEHMIETKTAAERSLRTMETLRAHCRKFAKTFQSEIASVKVADIENWLCRVAPRPRSRHNMRASLINLFRFAQKHGDLPSGAKTEAELTERIKIRSASKEILSPEEFASLLKGTTGEAQLYAAIGGLAGLRSSELMRLDWSNIDEAGIEVSSECKTGQRRVVPVCETLKLWIQKHRKPKGRVFSKSSSHRVFLDHIREILPNWPKNGLRNSFCTYRVAETRDMPLVALEAGNSPTIINRHYRQIRTPDGRAVTPELAKMWFSSAP